VDVDEIVDRRIKDLRRLDRIDGEGEGCSLCGRCLKRLDASYNVNR
jgi:hypothetical protein